LTAFKDALWAAGEHGDVGLRDPRDPGAPILKPASEPELAPLREALLARLAETGPVTVAELRQFAAAETIYRPMDVNTVLTALVASGAVARGPAAGRLGGDVLIRLAYARAGTRETLPAEAHPGDSRLRVREPAVEKAARGRRRARRTWCGGAAARGLGQPGHATSRRSAQPRRGPSSVTAPRLRDPHRRSAAARDGTRSHAAAPPAHRRRTRTA